MTKRRILFFIIISLLFIPLFPDTKLNAETGDTTEQEENDEKIESLQEKIEKYEEKIKKLQGQVNTLSREIESVDAQVNVTQLKIQNAINNINKTEKEIQKLSGDIEDKKVRINNLVERINYQKDILIKRIRERYKTRETSPVMILFGSATLDNLVKKASYLRVMEVQDKKVLKDMNTSKNAYDREKKLLETNKEDKEELQASLIQQKANLDALKLQLQDKVAEKKRLLDVTQNDEQKYQKLLSDAKKELDQITGAVSVLKGQGATKVKKGQKIGVQGNTGYSFGDHLHFGVYKYDSFADIDGWNWYYSNYVDPLKKLKKKEVYWDDGCSSTRERTVGSGDWAWPISDPTVSQGFGHTCWSNSYYGGKDHPALDMYGPYGTNVYAADDGDAYFCNNCLGDGAHGVFIFHDDGYMTIYWHLK